MENRSGGYQNLDARGNQLLIRYRNTPQIAQQVTLRDVLDESENFNPAWVKNRIVLIGVIAPSVPDIHDTPHGEIRGLYVHAHVISQILSAVEDDNRPLLWWFPQWGDALWVLFWSFTGGVIVWGLPTHLRRGVGVGIAIAVLYGVCWFVFAQGGWLPLVPSVLGLVLTGGVVVVYPLLREGRMNDER